eukprot:CAMPEP_0176486844 /NCGR_PEP_ID=MMETSP0200_2-20121128/5792_1 /TAXON_ID=947934 /ORGANISM="Chaetoceros sp., Strain GSL56" /LENGTH=570 /DNA_ID=CAMNT_0017883587 /DNA_START=353 /DNA_END=2065 /DNA_ORIENTATION=+
MTPSSFRCIINKNRGFPSMLLTSVILLVCMSKWPHTSGLLLDQNPNGTQIFDDGDTTAEDNGLPLRKWIKEAKFRQQKGVKKIRQALSAEEKKILSDFYAAKNGTSSVAAVDDGAARQAPKATDHVYDVIIVGAGWSGCSAAMTLESKGVTNFLVLEAKDHIGGRSFTTNVMFEGESIPVDHGSMWIHGASSNPISDIALEFDIDMVTSTFNEKVYNANAGGAIPDSQVATIYRNRYENGFLDYQANRQDSTNVDQSLQTTANQYLNSFSGNFEKDVLRHFMSSYIELEYSTPISELSLWWWDSDELIGPDEDFLLPNGYGPLIEAYAAPIRSKIITNSPVTEIDYRTDNVKVVSGADSYIARKVIVTVPLGVLKAESIRFRPPLPLNRRRSIDRIGMGTMNKIFMFWPQEEIFWQRNIEIYGDIVNRDTKFNFFNFQPYNGDRPFLAALFVGETARELEDLYANDDPERYEQEIRDLAMEPLRNIFGNDIPLPQKVFVTKWNSDEYTQGCYSFNKVGMGRDDRQILRRPIRKKRLFLSGEATHPTYFQTTHGAYLAGRRDANRVLMELQ